MYILYIYIHHCTVYIIYRLSQTYYIFASQNSNPKSIYMSRTDKGGSGEHVYIYKYNIYIYHTDVAMYISILWLLYTHYTHYIHISNIIHYTCIIYYYYYIEAFEWSTMYGLFRESSLQHPLHLYRTAPRIIILFTTYL